MPPKKQAKSSVQQDRAFDMIVSGQRAEAAMPSTNTLMTLMPLAEIAKKQDALDKWGLGYIVDDEVAYMKQAAKIVKEHPHLKFVFGCSGMALVSIVAQRLRDAVAEREGEAVIQKGVDAMVAEKPSLIRANAIDEGVGLYQE